MVLKGVSLISSLRAIRIIKEMRYKTNNEKPRYIIWENVPGAFSSNGGEDFRTVLNKIASIKDEDISIPKPSKWKNTGEVLQTIIPFCFRVLDAKYFGVPPKDAEESFLSQILEEDVPRQILFDQESLPWDTGASKEKEQGNSNTTKTGINKAIWPKTKVERGWISMRKNQQPLEQEVEDHLCI